MIPNQNRRKGGGPLLGATLPGQPGPFGTRPDPDHDDTETPDMASLATDRVQQQIDDARTRREAQRRRREALNERRRHGLAARHRLKLQWLRQREERSVEDDDGNTDDPPPDAA